MSKSLKRNTLLLFLISLFGVLTILYSTTWGGGLNGDAYEYINGAESLLRGKGFSHITQAGEVLPLTHWPPLFSMLLTSFGFVGIEIAEGGRWLNAVLFGINILLVGHAIYRNTAVWPAIFGCFLILTSVPLLNLHAIVISEPLYIALGLCALYFLDQYINKSRISPLILAALLIGAAALTRYIGVTLIATICISVLIFSKRPLRLRLIDCLIAVFISSLPLLLWIVRNRVVSGHSSDMKLQVHLIQPYHLKDALYTFSLWFVPETGPYILRVLVLIPAAAVTVLMMRWLRKSHAPSICYLNAVYVLVYCLALVFFISFVAVDITFNARYLSPVFVSGVIILACYLHRLSSQMKRPLRIGMTAVCVLFCGFCVGRAIPVIKKAHQDGWGFEGRRWRESEIITSIKNLPGDAQTYSNEWIPLGYLTHRDIAPLPAKFDWHTGTPTSDYFQQLQAIGTTSASQRTFVIYTKAEQPYFPSEKELKQILSLKEIMSTADASIFEVLHRGVNGKNQN